MTQLYSYENRNKVRSLDKLEPSFPNSWHYDPEHYQKELEAFWYRMWINVCRSDEVASPRDYKVVSIGDQNLVLTRDLKGNLRAFHNTCRHRGSILCTDAKGRFEGGSIVCPYHAWTYSLEGDLIATPHQLESADFDMNNYSLYDVSVGEWGGFVFVNLSQDPAEPLEAALGDTPEKFKNYHPERLKVGFRYVHEIKGNWKLWFENFSECYHCPTVHPELINIVPIFSKGLGRVNQDPEWKPSGGDTMVLQAGSDIIPGGKTWTMDGQFSGPTFSGLTEEEANSVINGMQLRPNFFFIAHPDYVHTQQMIPTSPTTVQLTWDYLFEPETMEREDFDAKRAYELWHITNLQDAQNVEWQQSGIESGSRHHERSVFVPQETGPHQFNSWVMEVMESAGNDVLRRDG